MVSVHRSRNPKTPRSEEKTGKKMEAASLSPLLTLILEASEHTDLCPSCKQEHQFTIGFMKGLTADLILSTGDENRKVRTTKEKVKSNSWHRT